MLKVSGADSKTNVPQTVYTVRMSTGSARGSGMTEWRAGVWLCLVNKDGAAFLHRATPLSDPEVIEHELIEICQVRNFITYSLTQVFVVLSKLRRACQEPSCNPALVPTPSSNLTTDQPTLQADAFPYGLAVDSSDLAHHILKQ